MNPEGLKFSIWGKEAENGAGKARISGRSFRSPTFLYVAKKIGTARLSQNVGMKSADCIKGMVLFKYRTVPFSPLLGKREKLKPPP
jgi:hypothetical protein